MDLTKSMETAAQAATDVMKKRIYLSPPWWAVRWEYANGTVEWNWSLPFVAFCLTILLAVAL